MAIREKIPYDENVCPKKKECNYPGCTLGEVVGEKELFKFCSLYHQLLIAANQEKDEEMLR
ncbi:hypothetical protein HN682_08005 [Candidatus Peregrinibacteria bacterium]|jgi:hypothetical protein|nr:hypothetical protein [Candidatus Peregrinibacteria bacterium]